ncbi:CocE/NonD family hydrolase [Roseiterribacter gracilis]|uniref:Antibiotic hydrolase n=1 Tax=Roseiterribacter gracilis TaxID=2812848 RepID=A0A8S8XJ95_9PROT|nr:antibiotic hydrolase [Rhodospirillales bacterium TMPK1]
MQSSTATLNRDGVAVETNVPIAMRDGTVLVADIYRPDGVSHPLPALLQRTPYDRTGLAMAEISVVDPTPRRRSDVAAKFAREGYVVVVQDCRGRYGSDGEFSKYVHEAEDGHDTIEWVARQEWCDGRVGTYGLSYEAHAQLAAACLNPRGLACMALDSGGFWDAFQAGIRQGGCLELKQLTWAIKHARLAPETLRDPARRAALEAERIEDWVWRWPWSEGNSPLAAAPEFEDYVLQQWRHAEDGPFWQRPDLCARRYLHQIADVPSLLIGSWYDPYASTTLATFDALVATKQSQMALVMGPWTHGRRSESYAGDVEFGANATLDGSVARDYDALRLDWFARWLKPDARIVPAPNVRVFVMGGGDGRDDKNGRVMHGGTWHDAQQFPPAPVTKLPFYLQRDGTLTEDVPAEDRASLGWTHDPDHPVPTIGGAMASGAPLMDAGAFDQSTRPGLFGATAPYGPLADRDDVLSFETAPLSQPMTMLGAAELRLFVSSDRPDTDLVVRLIDVHPSGYAMNLCHAVLRLRYRDSFTAPSLLEPGKIYEIALTSFPTANRFDVGHRIRVEIASSSFPHFDPNPGTGGVQGMPDVRHVAHNRLYLDAAHASHMLLPIASEDE